jgi:ABC-type antimicrobial peptide transport system permease subunit
MAGAAGGSIPPDQYGPNVLFVRFRHGVDRVAATARLQDLSNQLGDYNSIAVTPVQRPAEIVNANDITGSSSLLAIAVAVASLASFALALAALIRRRARDLALLRAIGFSGRQVTTAVSGAATAIVLGGLLIGVPLGAIVGRLLWRGFAGQLDVLAHPVFPTVAVVVTIVVALVAANGFAALASRRARTVPAASVLRDE